MRSICLILSLILVACGVEGPPGPTGRDGPQGPEGDKGPIGNPGASLEFAIECANTVTIPVAGSVTLVHRIFIMQDEARMVTCEVSDARGTYSTVRWYRLDDAAHRRALCEVRADAEQDATGGKWVFDHYAPVGAGTIATYEDTQGPNGEFSTFLGCAVN